MLFFVMSHEQTEQFIIMYVNLTPPPPKKKKKKKAF